MPSPGRGPDDSRRTLWDAPGPEPGAGGDDGGDGDDGDDDGDDGDPSRGGILLQSGRGVQHLLHDGSEAVGRFLVSDHVGTDGNYGNDDDGDDDDDGGI